MTKIVGIGAGGHARVLLDLARRQKGINVVGLLARSADSKGTLDGTNILGGEELLPSLLKKGVRGVFIGVGGVGDNRPRQEIFDRVRKLGFQVLRLVHPSAVIASGIEITEGTVVMAGVIVNAGVKIGVNVILNSGSILDHDCLIGDHVHIAPGAVLSGGVKVANGAHVGVGATVMQGISIGERAIVGAGAAVIHDVPAGAVVAGVPARILRNK